MKKQRTKKKEALISNRVLVVLTAILVIAISTIGLLQLGFVGRTLHNLLLISFGSFPELYFVVFMIIALISIFFYSKPLNLLWYHIVGLILLWLSFQLILVLSSDPQLIGMAYLTDYFGQIGDIYRGNNVAAGGVLGSLLYAMFSFLVDKLGTLIVAIVSILAGFILLFNNSLETFVASWDKMRNNRKSKPKKVKPPITVEPAKFKQVDMEEALKKQVPQDSKPIFIDASDVTKDIDVKQDFNIKETTSVASEEKTTEYVVPSVAILDQVTKTKTSSSNADSASSRGQKLLSILQQFDISSELIETHIGPSVTKFELKLDPKVKVNRILSLQDNLMMELAVKDIRIEAPIPGRNAVGVEIPNIEMTPVRLSEMLNNVPADKKDKKLLFALGKNLMGQPTYGELNKMPHLLIAGATGSGKSVAVNAMITTLLMRTKPSEVKLLLIDPKKVEFSVFNDVPHLIAPVVSDPVEAAKSLRVIVNIMENRYDAFSKVGARNITSYNDLVANDTSLKFMPNIVIIIDELADLMAVAGKEVETSIQRITQLARAAGIHLVVATQRPSVDVITGVIKANIPSRIAFAVSSGTDSRTILDTTGAESLLGYGDMLYVPIGEPHPIRIQGVYVSDEEVSRVASYAKAQGSPHYDDAFMNLEGTDNNIGYVEATNDPLFEEVKQFVIDNQKASTSLLQRHFGIGYNRGARLIDTLESQGIIGPAQGSKPRDVYVKENEEMDENEL